MTEGNAIIFYIRPCGDHREWEWIQNPGLSTSLPSSRLMSPDIPKCYASPSPPAPSTGFHFQHAVCPSFCKATLYAVPACSLTPRLSRHCKSAVTKPETGRYLLDPTCRNDTKFRLYKLGNLFNLLNT